MSSHRFLTIPVQFVTERTVSETAEDARLRIVSLIQRSISVMNISLSVGRVDCKKTGNQEDEPSRVIRLHGAVTLLGSDQAACFLFVRMFVALREKSLYLSVDHSNDDEDRVFDPLSLDESVHTTSINAFRLGSRVGYTDFVSHFDSRTVYQDDFDILNLTASFEHDMHKFRINFFNRDRYAVLPNVGTNYEVRVKYEAVSTIVLMLVREAGGDLLRVFFILKSPPLLYEMVYTHQDARFFKQKAFCRTATLPVNQYCGGITKQDWGRCNVLSIEFPVPPNSINKYAVNDAAVIDPWNLISNLKRFTGYTNPIPFYFAHMEVHEGRWLREPRLVDFAPDHMFPLLYAVKCCTSVSHQFVDDLCLTHKWQPFFQYIADESEFAMPVLEKALFDLFKILERNEPISVFSTFMDTYSQLVSSHFVDLTHVKGIRKIRRAVLTPTRVVLLPPHPFVESRLLKVCEPDFALRCHVRDDDDNMLTFSIGIAPPERQRQFLQINIRDPVLSGIEVGDRSYHFLGSSASQLREHGITLYARDRKGNDADYYRRNIGDFSRILCVGKYIARVGQAFSQMLESVIIDAGVLPDKIPDVKHGQHPKSLNPYCFTDGVGIVSRGLAEKFAEKLGLDFVPSAFQIRYKGCKGLVVLSTIFQSGTKYLGYRPSMDKFPCDSDTLEILKYSCPRPVYLNRPLVNLLDQLGTPLITFERLLADQLLSLINAFLDEDSAMQCIKEHCPAIFSLLKMGSIQKSGLCILSEPFFRKVLDIIVKKKMRELREYIRIQIPYDEGRNMFGVCDEYKCLEYGQVFVQYTHSSGERKVLTGQIMVTKNPCMHPGDVRKFMAVDRRELHHIVDCIVFPTKGERPHPNEMAGSDLDGDEYSVFWMEDLFFSQPNQTAMVFNDEPALELTHSVEVADIMNFVCEYIRTNTVGLIANAHLAISDSKSIFFANCLNLCHKYSYALDFAKTGRNVELLPEERAKDYPDFMEKGSEHSSYTSSRALGTLFRRVDYFGKAVCYSGGEADLSHTPNPLITCKGWEKFAEIALDDFAKYKMTCDSLLKELAIESEEYLLTSICQRNGKFVNGKKKDMQDMQDMLERIVRDTFEAFRKRFEANTASTSDRQKKAVAYYMVTRVNQMWMSDKKWHGFPWIAATELATLVPRTGTVKNLQDATIANQLDKIIIKNDAHTGARRFLDKWMSAASQRKHSSGQDVDRDWKLVSDALLEVHMAGLSCGDHLRPSAGVLVVCVLKKLIMDMMQGLRNGIGNEENSHMGVSALISLNKCLRTGKIDCLTEVEVEDSDSHRLRLKRFHVSLANQATDGFRALVNSQERKVLNYLRNKSKVKLISARKASQYKYRYWLVTAVGDEWSLSKLSNLLIQHNFYSMTTSEINLPNQYVNETNNNVARYNGHA